MATSAFYPIRTHYEPKVTINRADVKAKKYLKYRVLNVRIFLELKVNVKQLSGKSPLPGLEPNPRRASAVCVPTARVTYVGDAGRARVAASTATRGPRSGAVSSLERAFPESDVSRRGSSVNHYIDRRTTR